VAETPSLEIQRRDNLQSLDWATWRKFKKLRLGLFRFRPVEQNEVFWGVLRQSLLAGISLLHSFNGSNIAR